MSGIENIFYKLYIVHFLLKVFVYNKESFCRNVLKWNTFTNQISFNHLLCFFCFSFIEQLYSNLKKKFFFSSPNFFQQIYVFIPNTTNVFIILIRLYQKSLLKDHFIYTSKDYQWPHYHDGTCQSVLTYRI